MGCEMGAGGAEQRVRARRGTLGYVGVRWGKERGGEGREVKVWRTRTVLRERDLARRRNTLVALLLSRGPPANFEIGRLARLVWGGRGVWG